TFPASYAIFTLSLHDALPICPIYTKVKDEPPTRYIAGSKVRRALIANGSTIMGEVADSIISRGVYIKKNARLEKCIIMQKCVIRSEEHTSELQSRENLVCRLL